MALTATHWNVLLVYLGFTLFATLLAVARRWMRPGVGGESVWRKYPSYILLNLGFLTVSWLPSSWHVLAVLLALLGGLAAWEMAQSLGLQRTQKLLLPLVTVGLVAAADFFDPTIWFKFWLAVLLLLVMFNTLRGFFMDYGRRALALAGAVVYLPLSLSAYLWLRQADEAGFIVVFLYLVVATNDALAQITGQLWGRTPLSPVISPAKTVEGAVGGLLFAGAMALTLGWVFGWDLFRALALGLTLGVTGLVGDLTASTWKRALGIKNFSDLLGAQGGVLDRFDGLILAAPVLYLLVNWL